MNILVASDQFLYGGMEDQITNHVRTLEKKHNFCFVFGKYEFRKYLEKYKVYDGMNFNPIMSVRDVLSDVSRLCRIFKEESIDIIEVHPFYAFLPVMIAANKCNIPVIHMMHGAPSIVFDTRSNLLATQRFFMMDFAHCILMPSHLFDDVLQKQYGVKKLVVAPNTIEMAQYDKVCYDPKGRFALFSRLDDDKLVQIQKAFDVAKLLDLKIDVYGKGSCLSKLKDYVIENCLADRIEFKGWADDLPKTLKCNNYAGIIGGSRVALEGLASNLPTLLIGWDKVSGFIDADIYEKIKDSNISNRALPELPNSELRKQFCRLQENPNKFRLRELVKNDFDNGVLVEIFSKVFSSAIGGENHFDWLDALESELQKEMKDNDILFFNSVMVSELMEKLFAKYFVTNPLAMEPLKYVKLQKEIDVLNEKLYADSIYLGNIQKQLAQLEATNKQKTRLKRGVKKVVGIMKRGK